MGGAAENAGWRLMGRYMGVVDIYKSAEVYLAGVGRVPRVAGQLLAVHLMNSDINNGGLHQFFGNASGIVAPEALDGLRAMGAGERAAILGGAMELFGGTFPRECEARGEVIGRLEKAGETRKEWDPFWALTESYFACKEDLHGLMDRYAAASGLLDQAVEVAADGVDAEKIYGKVWGIRSMQKVPGWFKDRRKDGDLGTLVLFRERLDAAGERFVVKGVDQGVKSLTVRLSEGKVGRFSRTPRGVMLMIYEGDGGHMTYGLDEGAA